MTHQEFLNEVDMLKGNINRMCVTDDAEELVLQYHHAKRRLDWLLSARNFDFLHGNFK